MSTYDEIVAESLADNEGVNYSTEDGWAVCSVIERPNPFTDPAGWHASFDDRPEPETHSIIEDLRAFRDQHDSELESRKAPPF